MTLNGSPSESRSMICSVISFEYADGLPLFSIVGILP